MSVGALYAAIARTKCEDWALERARLVAWWDAYLAILPVLLAAGTDGDPTRKAEKLAHLAVGAFDRAQPS